MSQYTDIANIFNLGNDILNVDKYDNGTIKVQLGNSQVEDDVQTDEAEYWQQPGLFSLPAKATQNDSSCQAISIINSDYDMIIATRDIRANSLHDDLGPGELQIFAGGPDNKGICKITLNNDSKDTQSITITVNETRIVVSSDGNVKIDAKKVDIAQASDFAAMSAKVMDNLTKIAADLKAIGTAAGSPSAYIPSSVAASDTKIS